LDPRNAGHNPSTNSIEGRYMRQIMKVFDSFMRDFHKRSSAIKMDLPGLESLNIKDKVMEGELTITKYVSIIF
jgi:hypothetical protein